MQRLEVNITNLFGKRGELWLADFPVITESLAKFWDLSNIQPVGNMTWNYVVKAVRNDGLPVVVKISCDEALINNEVKALQHFNSYGVIRLLDHNPQYCAILLSQAVSGNSLGELYPASVETVIDHYVTVVQQLCAVPQTAKENFSAIKDWLTAIDKADKTKLPAKLLEQAINLKNNLLATSRQEFVLHGDLHHDNILSDGNHWVAIDPKGIIGEKEFEVACFDFINESELDREDIPSLFEYRVNRLANKLSLNVHRLKGWVFVRLILGACWMVEDNGDASPFIKLCYKIFPDCRI